jgi:energy-coupling factor transporter ATP-binding protein EcfA2
MDTMSRTSAAPSVLDVVAAPVVILVGHFGSGKSEIVLNLALLMRDRGRDVSVVDLDVVKPYFRCRQAREELQANGIRLVAPEGELAFADVPIILPAVRDLLRQRPGTVLLDVGGDPVGARALGSLADVMPAEEAEHLHVLNFNRPYTGSVDDAVEMIRTIESAARLPVTGLVSNTHLLGESTPEIVLEGLRLAQETARRVGRPVLAVAADEDTARRLTAHELPCPLLVLRRMIRTPFELPRRPRPVGRLFTLS